MGMSVGDVPYKLLLVAFSICSSKAVLAPEDHHPIILYEVRLADERRAGVRMRI